MQGSFHSLNSLVREYLFDKRPEEIPIVRVIAPLIDISSSSSIHYIKSKQHTILKKFLGDKFVMLLVKWHLWKKRENLWKV